MRRVVVTGIGIVSCLGNDRNHVLESLQQGRSGIRFRQEYVDHGMRSHIAGVVDIDLDALIDRKYRRFMGDAAAYAYLAMQQAIEDAQLTSSEINSPRTGLIAGSGGASSHNQVEACNILHEKGLRRIGPYRVTRTMGSTVSACLATSFGIQGINYSISSACATSAHCIGAAMEQIQLGKQDIIFAGGAEEESWEMSCLFDAMGAFSTNYNDDPTKASRPYDANRDGFVIAGGSGILVLEEYEHALKRKAPIYAELTGYGANSDGVDMVVPSGKGSELCMELALAQSPGTIDYINTHGTSTPVGDIIELNSLRKVFQDKVPPLSSTKSLTGHSLGATGAQEAIYCLLMMQNQFICASANIEELDPQAEGFDIVRTRRDNVQLNRILSNSFGFGGTNASLIFSRL